jgi:hypothetical protein
LEGSGGNQIQVYFERLKETNAGQRVVAVTRLISNQVSPKCKSKCVTSSNVYSLSVHLLQLAVLSTVAVLRADHRLTPVHN